MYLVKAMTTKFSENFGIDIFEKNRKMHHTLCNHKKLLYFVKILHGLGPEYVENISSSSLKKTSDQGTLRLLSVYLSIFER